MSSRWVLQKSRAEGEGKNCELYQVVIIYPEKTKLRAVEREHRGVTYDLELLERSGKGFKYQSENRRKKSC